MAAAERIELLSDSDSDENVEEDEVKLTAVNKTHTSTHTTTTTTPAATDAAPTVAGVNQSPSQTARPPSNATKAKTSNDVSVGDVDDEYDIDDLIEVEQQMHAEAAAAEQEGEHAGGIDYSMEGGGFFTDDAPAADEHGAAVGSAEAASASSASVAASGGAANSVAVESLEEDAPARPFSSGCRECGSIGVQQSFLQAFGVSVCYKCQRANPNRYALITQTTATSQYMLPVTWLQQRLGHIEKKNPHKHAWGVMKLYWKQQVLALVRERYGTIQGLEAAKQARDVARIAKDDARRRQAHRTAARSAQFASTVAASIADSESKTPAQVAAMLAQVTKGMATDREKGQKQRHKGGTGRKRNKKASAAADEGEGSCSEDDHPKEEDEYDPLANMTPAARKRARKQQAAILKQQHLHVFEDVADGQQRCKECGFVQEFETF